MNGWLTSTATAGLSGPSLLAWQTSVDLRGLPETVRIRDAITSDGASSFTVLMDPIEVSE